LTLPHLKSGILPSNIALPNLSPFGALHKVGVRGFANSALFLNHWSKNLFPIFIAGFRSLLYSKPQSRHLKNLLLTIVFLLPHL
jgi:hypothetical protein